MLDAASQPAKSTPRAPRAPSLEKGIAILELLGESRRGLTLSETARRLGLPKSTTHCLLTTLRAKEYVVCSDKTGRFLLGPRFFRLSNVAIQGARLRERTSELLHALHESTRLTVHLAILDGRDVVLIEKLESSAPARVATWVGRRMEVHCTGLGKAILAFLPREFVEEHIRTHGLPKHNENTLATPKRLWQDLEKIRASGFAWDDEEDEIGFRCVAAPIFDQAGGVIAALSVAGNVEQISEDNMRGLAAATRRAADAISALMQEAG